MVSRSSVSSNMTTASVKSNFSGKASQGKMFGISAFASLAFVVLLVLIGTAIALSMNNTEIKKSAEKYKNKYITR